MRPRGRGRIDLQRGEKEEKGERRMPWLPVARKDADSRESARGSANTN